MLKIYLLLIFFIMLVVSVMMMMMMMMMTMRMPPKCVLGEGRAVPIFGEICSWRPLSTLLCCSTSKKYLQALLSALYLQAPVL